MLKMKEVVTVTAGSLLSLLVAVAGAGSAYAGGVTWNGSATEGRYHVDSTTTITGWSTGQGTEVDIQTSPGVPATVTGTFDQNSIHGSFSAGSPVIDPTISVTYSTLEYGSNSTSVTTKTGTLSVFDFSHGFQINPLRY